MKAGVPAALLVLALALGASAAAAGAEETRGWRFDTYNDLMSPYCPGRTLNDCPSPQAAELRAWIAAQEQAGRSRDEVEQQLYRRYGDVLRSAPEARGWGLTAYVIPLAAIAVGGALLAAFLRRQGPEPVPVAAAPADPELERRIDEELRSARP